MTSANNNPVAEIQVVAQSDTRFLISLSGNVQSIQANTRARGQVLDRGRSVLSAPMNIHSLLGADNWQPCEVPSAQLRQWLEEARQNAPRPKSGKML